MKALSTNGISAAKAWTRCSVLIIICLGLASGCDTVGTSGGGSGGSGGSGSGSGSGSGGDGDGDGSDGDVGTDGLIDAKIFDVDMQVKSYDTTAEGDMVFASVASMLFGTFPLDPLAVSYTVEYIDPVNTAFEAEATWDARNIAGVRAPVPDTFAVSAGVVPGYVDGVVGEEYFIRVAGSGCQGGAAGNCRLGTESTEAMEDLLKDIRATGTLRVTIEYE